MKRSDLKELIKKSMLEVAPKGGEMTPEEEKMVADYEEEEANKYAVGPKEEPSLEEEASKAAAILNRPSNKITFEQMGMIMMLADELGGEENAKANEFLSGVVSKMEADKYIQELIAKIDQGDVLAEAEKIVAAWAEKQTLNEEMYGGYLELLEMNPAFDEGVAKVLEAWDEWKEGEMTEPYMVEEAKHDILAYLSSMMK
jgi:hypothetical protein